MEGAGGGFVAGGGAGGAEGFLVEVVAVGVELVLGEVCVVGNIVVGG